MIASLEAEVVQRAAQRNADRKAANIRSMLVAPLPDTLPDDGLLKFVPITNIYELANVEEGTVILIDVNRDLDLLKMIQTNGPLLGVDTKVLVGVPTAEYTAGFDEVVWQSDRVSYAPLLSELSIGEQLRGQTRLENMTQHDHERAQYTRSDGTVKVDERIVLASAMRKPDVDVDDENEGDDA